MNSWEEYTQSEKHEYISGVQCDNDECYACATQRHSCKRLEQLDAESSGLI